MPERERQPVPRKARLAVASAFGVNGIVFGNWFVRIPAVQEKLDLSASALGLGLLGLPFGAIIAMPIAGWLVARHGSRPVLWIASTLVAAGIILPAVARDLLELTAALALVGAATGAMDVSMNAQGVAVERRFRRTMMASFHGVYSGLAMLAALAGGVVASQGVGVEAHMAGTALVAVPISLALGFWLMPASADIVARQPGARRLPSIPRPLFLLGVIGFCGLLAEGAMADWSAIFLRQDIGTGSGVAALGFAVFSGAMTAGRFTGDWLTDRLGALAIVRGGSIVSASGLALAIMFDNVWAALTGFMLVGLGLSVIVPIVFSSAGRMRGAASGPSIAVVTTLGYVGFMVGPPGIGFLADLSTLRWALGAVVGLNLLMAALSGAVRAAGDLTDRH